MEKTIYLCAVAQNYGGERRWLGEDLVMVGSVGLVEALAEVEEAGAVHGLAEGRSATCLHGRGQDGYSVEELAGGF